LGLVVVVDDFDVNNDDKDIDDGSSNCINNM
jgi:hypothetical protein